LGPKAASTSGNPSAEAKRFIDETTAADRPRVYRNAVVLAVPSRDGLEVAGNRIREYLGWEEVRSQLKDQDVDPIRYEMLLANIESARKKIPEAIQQAYCIVVTVSDKNEIHAFKIAVSNEPLFSFIKAESRSRIQETAISADALLPEGPYNLWREGESSRRVKDLVGAFAQFPHLPKMLNRRAILDTIVIGCKEGQFVLRTMRPDRSIRTFWRNEPGEADLKDPSLEVVLPEAAILTEISATLLAPEKLSGLWPNPEILIKDVFNYFSGGHNVKIKKEGYEESVIIPKAERAVVETAIHAAVRDDVLWLTSGPASVFAETIPAGILTDEAQLQGPPQPISAMDILPSSLHDVWSEERTNGLAISVALSQRIGKTLPWATIREAIDGALRARLIERTLDSGPWPCEYTGAQLVKLRLPSEQELRSIPPQPVRKPGVLIAEAALRPNEIQDLADQIADITKATVGLDLKFHLRIELGSASRPSDEVIFKINRILQAISGNLRLQ
jgi:hypothetical protein